jgi:hypothetical protein
LSTELEPAVYNSSDSQKYLQMRVSQSGLSQVNTTYQPKSAPKPKSQLILPSLSDPPISNGNHLPVSPTTPLEHFSTFRSSHLPHASGSPVLRSPQTCPPSHLHLPLSVTGSPVLHSPQACPPPPPYSSAASGLCYAYDTTTYQAARSSVNEQQWPPHLTSHTHTAQALQRPQRAEGFKDNISLRSSSSSVVSLAGQKRPGCEANNLPPTKLALLGHTVPAHSNTSAPLHRHPDQSASPYPTLYPAPYPGGSSFPH